MPGHDEDRGVADRQRNRSTRLLGEQFVYVDRVAVAKHARRRGLARMLYEDLFGRAAAAGHDVVACEVNIEPPNPVSDAFHASLGFAEAGSAAREAGKKAVRYHVRYL